MRTVLTAVPHCDADTGGGVVTLHQLEVFAAVVAAGSFSGAARRLGLTQPAVSLQIRGLEEHFGTVLLDRFARGVRLTEAGQQVHAHTARILMLLQDLEAAVRGETDAPAGVLHLGCSTTPGDWLLPRLLTAFRERYPNVQLNVEVTDTAIVLDRLLRRQYDLGLVGGVGHTDRLEFVPFAADELLLIAPRDHPLASRAEVAPAELATYPFVFREEGSGTRAAAEQALERLGLPRLPVATVLGSGEAVKQAVAAGVGLAFVSGATLAAHEDDLVVLPFAASPIERRIYVAMERGRSAGRLTQAFATWLLSPEARARLGAQRHVRPISALTN
jgi:DNA-binding transcriptional LysR family regulator